MAKKKKFYVVWKGKNTGIFESWDDCQSQIKGIKGAQFKAFDSFEAAKKAYNGNYVDYKGGKKGTEALSSEELLRIGTPNMHSISVDAASSGNPGLMEYRGVDTYSKKPLFKQGPFQEATNNIGEFLAIVHGLAFLKDKKSDRVIYSDSRTAMSWVRKKNAIPNSKKQKPTLQFST